MGSSSSAAVESAIVVAESAVVPSKAPGRSAEIKSVDDSVMRSIRTHMKCYGDQLAWDDITVHGQKLFPYVKAAFIEHRSRGENLAPAWWAKVHDDMQGVAGFTKMDVPKMLMCPGFAEPVSGSARRGMTFSVSHG